MVGKMNKEKELIEKQIDITKPIEENCPQWNGCSCNRCPLSSDYKKAKVYGIHPQTKCLLGKTRRKRILRWYSTTKASHNLTTKEKTLDSPLQRTEKPNQSKKRYLSNE